MRNWRVSEASETLSGVYKFELMRYVYVIVIPWVLGVYLNKTPLSRGRSLRVRAFCSDIPRSNHGITILYPKSSSHLVSLFKIITKMVTIIVKIFTKMDRKKYTSC